MTTRQAKKIVRDTFSQGGCVRAANLDRRSDESSQVYKKGYEVRFSCRTKREVKALNSALVALGIVAGNPYPKHSRTIVPVYGREQVAFLVETLGLRKPYIP